jgi:UDP-glucose 4-epimerase
MNQRVLITGASGFVGFHLIIEALNNNLDVFAAIRKSSKIAHLKNLDITFTYPDFTDVDALATEIIQNKYDYIIHAAGVTAARSADEYNYINAGYTYNLAQAVVKSGTELKRFVLISSLAALGPLNNLSDIITEDTPPMPVTAYGKSKLMAEEKLKSFPYLNYTILRPTGVYGPRDKDIFIFFKQLASGIEPYIGNKAQKLSLIYVTDVAKGAIKSLHAGNKKTFNLTDGNAYDRYQIANITKQVLQVKTFKFHLPVIFVKFIAMIAEKYSSLRSKAAVLNVEKLNELMAVSWDCDITKAKTELGFSPEHNLQSGITTTLAWYKANKWL